MPSRLSALTDALKDWFQTHGKVVFTFGIFNVLLIVFCVVYWSIELPMYPSNAVDAVASWFTPTLPESNILGLYGDITDAVFKFYLIQLCILSVGAYMVYILREMRYMQLQSQRVAYDEIECLRHILDIIRYVSNDLIHIVQGAQAMKDNVVERCEIFENLLEKVVGAIPEHSRDIRNTLYLLHDMTEDLLIEVKREIRTLIDIKYNSNDEKEETVELTASSAEASEAHVVPTITPKTKRVRKLNTSGSSGSVRPLLSSTRLGSRRANDMIQQAMQ